MQIETESYASEIIIKGVFGQRPPLVIGGLNLDSNFFCTLEFAGSR